MLYNMCWILGWRPEELEVPDFSVEEVTGVRIGRGLAFLAGSLLALTLAMIIAPQWIAPFDPRQADPSAILRPPNAQHWLGTDVNGMDILSRIVWGARIDLAIAGTGTTIALVIGTLIGAVTGYYAERSGRGGFASEATLRFADVMQAFPPLVLGLTLVAVLGRGIVNIIYVVAFVQIPFFLRLTRSSIIAIRKESFVDVARCSGNGELRVVFRHILPNALTPALVNVSVAMGSAVLLAAGLSFLGVGVPAPTPEWGYMVATGARNLYTGQWWPALFPGLYMGLVTLSLAVLGDAIREHLDPTLR